MNKKVVFGNSIILFLLMVVLSSCVQKQAETVLPAPEESRGMEEPLPIETLPPENSVVATAEQNEPEEQTVAEETPKPAGDVERQELSFDLSVAQAQPMDFDPRGPFFHTILKTSSMDGLSFGQETQVVFEHTSVPDVLRLPDGKIALYAVDGAGRSLSGLQVAFSSDEGMSWEAGSVQLESKVGHTGLADPEVVLLPDGTIRMYYVIFPQPNVHTGNNQIWSAVSSDGIHFVEEEGIRFTYSQLTDPDIVKIGQKWFVYFSQGPRSVAASSVDGNTFTLEKTIREQGAVSNTVPLGNNQWRQYYCNEGIRSAVSSDGLNWRDEPGKRITAKSGSFVCDPAPLKTSQGWILFYKENPQ